MGRRDLTDEQWAALEPLLPKGARAGRPPVWPRRQLIDGIRFRVRTGVPWRDVPAVYGPWGRVYDLFRRWQRDGTWQRILTRLQSLADAAGAIVWDLSVDSTVCRAHQHAAGARKQGDLQKEPPGGVFTEPGDHGLGRSRGGFSTKLHLAVEQGQKPMSIVVTAGQRGDSPQFETVLEKIRVPRLGPGRPRVRPDRLRADKAYASRRNRAYLRRRGIRCTIPDKADQARNRRKLGSRGGRRRASTRSTTASAMRSSAASTVSKGTALSPRAMTSLRSAMRRSYSSQPSVNGCDLRSFAGQAAFVPVRAASFSASAARRVLQRSVGFLGPCC
ncbi:Transposase [Streptomyces sp. TLI_105]|nr:Transposase [Streptomyces sp. TLI_105]